MGYGSFNPECRPAEISGLFLLGSYSFTHILGGGDSVSATNALVIYSCYSEKGKVLFEHLHRNSLTSGIILIGCNLPEI